METLDSILARHAAKIKSAVDAGTIGDSSYEGLLVQFLMEIDAVRLEEKALDMERINRGYPHTR